MTLNIAAVSFINFLAHFVADLIVVSVIAFSIFFRRHSRRDLLVAYTTLNVVLFIFMTLVSVDKTIIHAGFGLLAIISIIRIRSESYTNTELSYAFIILTVALINSFGVSRHLPTLADGILVFVLNLVAILAVFVVDHPQLLQRIGRQKLTLDMIHTNEENLRADLERRLDAKVLDYVVSHVDYVRDVTVIDVRYIAKV